MQRHEHVAPRPGRRERLGTAHKMLAGSRDRLQAAGSRAQHAQEVQRTEAAADLAAQLIEAEALSDAAAGRARPPGLGPSQLRRIADLKRAARAGAPPRPRRVSNAATKRAGRPDAYDQCQCGRWKRVKARRCLKCHRAEVNAGCFGQPGRPGGKPRAAIGAEHQHKRDGEWYVKIAESHPEPSRNGGLWIQRRLLNWVDCHGVLPQGLVLKRISADLDDDRPSNHVAITRAVNACLNQGRWTKPRRPWGTLPDDTELRLLAIEAAITKTLAWEAEDATERRRRLREQRRRHQRTIEGRGRGQRLAS